MEEGQEYTYESDSESEEYTDLVNEVEQLARKVDGLNILLAKVLQLPTVEKSFLDVISEKIEFVKGNMEIKVLTVEEKEDLVSGIKLNLQEAVENLEEGKASLKAWKK